MEVLTFSRIQGLIYELLYGKVFGMQDIDTAIQVMLYEGKQSKETFEVRNWFNLWLLDSG